MAFSYQPYQYPTYIPPRYDQQAAMQTAQSVPQPPQMQNAVNTIAAPQAAFLCRPVTSREEALAVPADFMSNGTIMPDLGHGMIYLKRFDSNTGLSNMFEFAMVQQNAAEESVPVVPDYSEILEGLGERLDSLAERLDDLADKLDRMNAKQVQKGAAK